MPIDINDAIENEDFKSSHMVYADGVKVIYPDKNSEIHFCALPAIADPEDKTSYLPYRTDDGKFTPWAAAINYWPFVNKERSIISPKSIDPSCTFDPIEELVKTAKANPKWALIAGFDHKTNKKIQDAYSNPDVKLPSKTMVYLVNGSVLYDKDTPQDEVFIIQVPATAFRGQLGGESKKSSWGLIGALNLVNRGASEDDSIDDKYYWGDITDPKKMVPLKLSLERPPTGGSVKIYNLVPQDDECVVANKSLLSKRYDLENIYCKATNKDIVSYLVEAFIDMPDLLIAALASRVPNIKKMIDNASSSLNYDPDEIEEEEIDLSPPKSKRRPQKEEVEEEEAEEEEEAAPQRRKFAKPVVDEEEDTATQEGVDIEVSQEAKSHKPKGGKITKSVRELITED